MKNHAGERWSGFYEYSSAAPPIFETKNNGRVEILETVLRRLLSKFRRCYLGFPRSIVSHTVHRCEEFS
jgi:hypothetical protein